MRKKEEERGRRGRERKREVERGRSGATKKKRVTQKAKKCEIRSKPQTLPSLIKENDLQDAGT